MFMPLQPRAPEPKPAILTSAQSDRSCLEFTPKTLLAELNRLSKYDLPLEHQEVKAGINFLITNGHDLGTAYAWFRTARYFPALPYGEPSMLDNAIRPSNANSTRQFGKPPSRFHLPDLSKYDLHLMAASYDNRDVVQGMCNCLP